MSFLLPLGSFGIKILLCLSAPCLSKPRDELVQMKALSRTNCSQLFSASSRSAPSSPSHLGGASTPPGAACPGSALIPSPAHNCQVGGLKQTTGVGGTTYEISVWAAMLDPAGGPLVHTSHDPASYWLIDWGVPRYPPVCSTDQTGPGGSGDFIRRFLWSL